MASNQSSLLSAKYGPDFNSALPQSFIKATSGADGEKLIAAAPRAIPGIWHEMSAPQVKIILEHLAKTFSKGSRLTKARAGIQTKAKPKPDPKPKTNSKLIPKVVTKAKTNPKPSKEQAHITAVEQFTENAATDLPHATLPTLEDGDLVSRVGQIVFICYVAPEGKSLTLWNHGFKDNWLERNPVVKAAIDAELERHNGKMPAGRDLYLLPDKKTLLFQIDEFSPRGMLG